MTQMQPRDDSAPTQSIKAVLGLRGLIIEGELRPGERVLEQTVVDKLGVSRTPARAALVRVCEEGLLESMPGGGYMVARFSESDVFDAICIRGNLEGMAARLAAEKGVGGPRLAAMNRCVEELDAVVQRLEHNPDLTEFVRLNDEFHELLLEGSQSPMLRKSLERLMVLPFATPNAFVSLAKGDKAPVREILRVAQEQHRCIVEAIADREGTRAERLCQEHSRSAWKYLRLVFQSGHAAMSPALRLIAR
jgi:GntR family transcriptional regulator, vanillate catabolism transcriptional regulator